MNKHFNVPSLFVLLLIAPFCRANNINVANVTLTGQNTTEDYALVQFDLSWDNSWRDVINWDAAWVFVKYQVAGSGVWNHASLNTTMGTHTIPGGFTGSVGLTGSAGVGLFIFRDTYGSGNNTLNNVQIRWEYGANSLPDFSVVAVQVFAVEMVYVPQGAFYVGDADNDQVNCFREGGTTHEFHITSEDAISVSEMPGNLYYDKDNDYGGDQSGPIPANFPKGYNAFYCMKYEISQGQWIDLFNTLTDEQKLNRDITSSLYSGKNTDNVLNRNTVSWTAGEAAVTRPDRACNYLCWADGLAYADWAGLRPMSELEFEKACRGDQPVVDDEFSWGTAVIIAATTISGTEDGMETITNSGANCTFNNNTYMGGDGGTGPLRCGVFAFLGATREQAGASYLGIMELSGNLDERMVSVGISSGRSFVGNHGDGMLSTDGNPNVGNWPSYLNARGSTRRGGTWWHVDSYCRVSYRYDPARDYTSRNSDFGFRCVRTSP